LKISKTTSNRPVPRPERPLEAPSSSRADERFHLIGRSLRLDPRIHAWRLDIADIALAGQIFAPHYARPLLRACGARTAPLYAGPGPEAAVLTELLPGEEFAVLEYAGGMAWGYARHDHVAGYVEAIALSATEPPDYIVCEASAPVSAEAALDSAVIATLPMGARLYGTVHGATLLTEYGHVPMSHVRALGDFESDPARVAERMMGTPYRAGGRTHDGIDGPGLVQLGFGLCGVPLPHLADQLRLIGAKLDPDDGLERGDLVLYPDGAGLMIDDLLMIHVGANTGKVTVGPLQNLGEEVELRRIPH
jgi:hypothetical protein